MHKKLFTPGPVEVYPHVFQAMTKPMITHRSADYEKIHSSAKENLKKILGVKNGRVFFFTCSSTGAMESSIRNLVGKKVLVTTCGAFSERFQKIARSNGKESDVLSVEWGMAVKPELIEANLKSGDFDAVTVVHSETSTGVLNRIEEIASMMKKYPDVSFIVDAVSSMLTKDIRPEELGVDFMLAGTQKGFGLPPGLTVVYASSRALEKAKKILNRGHYFDLLQYEEFDPKNQTPETPAVSMVYALEDQLSRICSIGIDKHYARIEEMADFCRAWTRKHFEMFPEKGYETLGLTCIKNTRDIDISKLNDELGKRGYHISEGYGKVKQQTFRIAHMGDITMNDLKELLTNIDALLGL